LHVKEEDFEKLKEIKRHLGSKHLYDVIPKLIWYYERVEAICNYLHVTPEQFFSMVTEYIDKLWRLSVRDKIDEMRRLLKMVGIYDRIFTPKEVEAIEIILTNALNRLFKG